MHSKLMCAAIVASVVIAPAMAGAIPGEFLVADANGNLFRVDGSTLQAQSIGQLQNRSFFNEIEYAGNGMLYVTNANQVTTYDLATGSEGILFDIDDLVETTHNIITGIELTQDGRLYLGVGPYGDPGSLGYGGYFNPATGGLDSYIQIEGPPGLYFDFQQIGADRFLGADWNGSSIYELNAATGLVENQYNLNFQPVSFLTMGEQLFALSSNAELHKFNLADGSSEYFGRIAGTNGSLIAAAIPAPAGTAFFGVFGLFASRRRR